MKVIDMLDKIANGENIKFKIDGDTYMYDGEYLKCGDIIVRWVLDDEWLSKDVEVCEGNDKIDIKKLDVDNTNILSSIIEIKKTINKIIDYINEEE